MNMKSNMKKNQDAASFTVQQMAQQAKHSSRFDRLFEALGKEYRRYSPSWKARAIN